MKPPLHLTTLGLLLTCLWQCEPVLMLFLYFPAKGHCQGPMGWEMTCARWVGQVHRTLEKGVFAGRIVLPDSTGTGGLLLQRLPELPEGKSVHGCSHFQGDAGPRKILDHLCHHPSPTKIRQRQKSCPRCTCWIPIYSLSPKHVFFFSQQPAIVLSSPEHITSQLLSIFHSGKCQAKD